MRGGSKMSQGNVFEAVSSNISDVMRLFLNNVNLIRNQQEYSLGGSELRFSIILYEVLNNLALEALGSLSLQFN